MSRARSTQIVSTAPATGRTLAAPILALSSLFAWGSFGAEAAALARDSETARGDAESIRLEDADRSVETSFDGALEVDVANPAGMSIPIPDVVGGYASDRVILKLAPGVEVVDGDWSLARGGEISEEARLAFSQANVLSISPLFRRGFANPDLAAEIGLDRYRLLEVPTGSDVPGIVVSLQAALGAVQGAIQGVVQGEVQGVGPGLVELVEADGIGGVAGDAPNDPMFHLQWALENTGQVAGGVAGLPGADVSALEAWSRTTGGGGVVVAVLDSGINPHPEFADRILPGLNVPDDNDQTNDVCASHGTAVSGVLAAAGDDGLGIAGMDWTMLLIPIVVVDPCSGPESHVAEALVFATDAGADIANMSLQYYAGTSALRDAVLYAHAAGVLMVAASGNNSANALAYPAAWPETIAVGASTNLDGRWSSSNTGEGISLVAPGLSIQTTNGFSGHSSRTGTSFAAPHVSGTASLMLSVDPWLDADSIRQTIEGTTLDLPPSGYDQFTGFGRLDAGAAVMAVRAPGDFNDDGRVDGVDLSTLLALWGECPPGGSCLADIDRDGRVDGIDLSILLGRWTG